MYRLIPLLGALALAVPDHVAAAEPRDSGGLRDVDVWWLTGVLSDLAEDPAFAASTHDAVAIDQTLTLLDQAADGPIWLASVTGPAKDGLKMTLVDSATGGDGDFAAELWVDVVYDDGFVASFTARVTLADGTLRVTGPTWERVSSSPWDRV